MEPFWLNDYRVLLIPSISFKEDATINQILNNIVKIFILVGLIFFFITSKIYCILLILFSLIFTYFLYKETDKEKFITANTSESEGKKCNIATKDNPFGNALPGDDPGKAPFCDDQADMTDKYFKLGLYRDVNDIFDKNNSQREYFTNPSTTIPNDREAFQKWCYGAASSCRDGDSESCLLNNSLLLQ